VLNSFLQTLFIAINWKSWQIPNTNVHFSSERKLNQPYNLFIATSQATPGFPYFIDANRD